MTRRRVDVAVEGSDLVVKRRPDTTLRARAVEGRVRGPTLGTVTFRVSDGRVIELSVKSTELDLRSPASPNPEPGQIDMSNLAGRTQIRK